MTGGEVSHRASLADVLERVLDKGIVIDAYLRVSVASIHLVDVEACIVVASVETYLEHERSLRARRPIRSSGSKDLLALERLNLPKPGSNGGRISEDGGNDDGVDGEDHGPGPDRLEW